jgi:protein disulfide-isomerase A1
MTKQSLPAVSNIDNAASLKDFKESDSVVLVAYFDADDKESNATFTAAANVMRDNYLFGATNDAELAKEDGVKQPAIVLYKSFDEGKVIYDGKFEKADIEAFAKKASVPLVGEVGPDTYQGYMSVSCCCLHLHRGSNWCRLAFLLRTSSPRLRTSARSSPRS